MFFYKNLAQMSQMYVNAYHAEIGKSYKLPLSQNELGELVQKHEQPRYGGQRRSECLLVFRKNGHLSNTVLAENDKLIEI